MRSVVGALDRDVGIAVAATADVASEVEADAQLSAAQPARRGWLL